MAIKSADQISIVDLTDGYSVILTSDGYTFPGTTTAAKAGSCTTQIIAMCGSEALSRTLTEGMDGCSDEYRQSDEHLIAAMSGEEYRVPSAYLLPDRMRELCLFLKTPEAHPLIKAAAAQAFILVTRPFDEGNERLARMLSAAVLMRCGYDFFNDISISSVLAIENYLYYKRMREILRQENGGDLTYFVEYYIELLVRSIDAKKERLRRREQEALNREIVMARETLRRVPETDVPINKGVVQVGLNIRDAKSSENDTDGEPEILLQDVPLDEYLELLHKFDKLKNGGKRNWSDKIRKMIDQGIYTFTVDQWAEQMNMGRKSPMRNAVQSSAKACCEGTRAVKLCATPFGSATRRSKKAKRKVRRKHRMKKQSRKNDARRYPLLTNWKGSLHCLSTAK